MENLQLIFLLILRIFDLEFHGQTSVQVELVMFGLVFMKFRKLRSLYRENKKLNFHKTLIFLLFKSFPVLLASWQTLSSKNWYIYIYKFNLVSRGTRLIDINYLKLCNTLFQLRCIRCYTPQFVIPNEIWKSISYSLL